MFQGVPDCNVQRTVSPGVAFELEAFVWKFISKLADREGQIIVPHVLETPLHRLHCTDVTAQTSLHRLHWTDFTAHTSLHRRHCTDVTAQTSLHRRHCTDVTARTSLHRRHCTDFTTQTSPHRRHCTDVTAQTSLHRFHCTDVNAQTSLHRRHFHYWTTLPVVQAIALNYTLSNAQYFAKDVVKPAIPSLEIISW